MPPRLGVSSLRARVFQSLALRASPNGRHLVDGRGQAVFIQGFTGWSLFTNCTLAESQQYIDDVADRGGNWIIANFIDNAFSNNSPASRNANGDLPFTGTAFQSSLNSAYVSHALAVVRYAASKNVGFFLLPAYLGFGGGSEGWHSLLESASTGQAETYGQGVGAAFSGEPNIVWVMGGDFDPPSHARVDAIRTGILATDTNARLFGFHGNPGQSGHAVATSWQQGFDWIYNQEDSEFNADMLHESVLDGYADTPAIPVIFCEGQYKEHSNAPSDLKMRRQAWGSFTAGACGHFYGHEFIWAFNDGSTPGAGIFDDGELWSDSLAATSRAQMAHVRTFIDDHPDWYLTAPDTTSTFITAGRGTLGTTSYTTARFSSTLGIAYMPNGSTGGARTVDRTEFSGTMTGHWFNPRTGAYTLISNSIANTGTQEFTPPDTGDWVLRLKVN